MKPELFINDEFQASKTIASRDEIVASIVFNTEGAPYCLFPVDVPFAIEARISRPDYTMSDCGYAESFPTFEFCEIE